MRQTAGLRICIWHTWQACLQPYRHNSLVQHGQGLGQKQALGCLKTVPQHSCTCTVRSVNVQQAAAASLTSNSSGPRKADTALADSELDYSLHRESVSDVPGMCRVAEACGAAWSHQQLEVRLSSRALVQACLHTGLHTPCARGAPCHLCSSAAQDELVRDMSGVLVAVRDADVQGFAVGWRVADELQARPAASNPPSGASHAQLKRWSALKPGSLFSRLHTPHHALHPPVNS